MRSLFARRSLGLDGTVCDTKEQGVAVGVRQRLGAIVRPGPLDRIGEQIERGAVDPLDVVDHEQGGLLVRL